MPGNVRRLLGYRWAFIIVIAVLIMAVEGGISSAAAVDRWVGSIVLEGIPFTFIVLVNPGVSASWEWRFSGVQIASGFLSASVSGSTVKGTLFTTGGAVTQTATPCCRPCNFSGTIAGNHAEGTVDPVTCDGSASWSLDKQP